MRKFIAFILMAALILALGGCGSVKQSVPALSKAEDVSNIQSASDEAGRDMDRAGAPDGVQRKITRDVSLLVTVTNVEEAVSKIEEIVKAAGGYIENEYIRQENQRLVGNLTLRIPVEKLDGTLSQLEGLGRVERKNITGKDVTEEYYDAQARKTTLEKQEKRLLELLNKANSVKEMLEIENELARVRGQIESLQGRLKVLDKLTSLATVNLELRTPKNISTGETLKEPLGQRIQAGWQRGYNGMVNFVEGLLISLVILLPYTPVLAVAGYGVYRLWKRRNPKNPEK